MPKRNSKSSNASSVVVVRYTALKVGAFSLSCSKLCNEWSLMSVRRAEAELRWFKRNRDNTLTMQDNTGMGHAAGDHVLVTAILSAIFIVTLVYLVVLGPAVQIQALRASWDPLLDSNKRQLGQWSVEDNTLARFSQHRPLQRRKQQLQHCRRQRSDAKHVLLILVLARRLETRKRSPRRSTRFIVATLREKILRRDTHWIAVFYMEPCYAYM